MNQNFKKSARGKEIVKRSFSAALPGDGRRNHLHPHHRLVVPVPGGEQPRPGGPRLHYHLHVRHHHLPAGNLWRQVS